MAPFAGWTLSEALARLTDRRSWTTWVQAKAAWEKIHGPITNDVVEWSEPETSGGAEWNKVRAAFATVRESFCRRLADESVVVVGQSRAGAIILTPHDWTNLTRVRWDESIVEDPSIADRLTSVRIYPIVHASNAPNRLVGLSLGEAFFKCVLRDAEVQSLAQEVIEHENCYSSVFRDGQYPGPYVEHSWDLDVTPSDLAFQFVRPVFFYLEDPLPEPSVEIRRVCEVIVDRMQALRGLLSSAKLVVWGTHVSTGNFVSVDQFQWSRKGVSLDVQNSDVWDAQKQPPTLRWTGLALQHGPMMCSQAFPTHQGATEFESNLPNKQMVFHVKPREPDGIRSDTIESVKRASRKGIARVESSIKDATECRDWLAGLMRNDPDNRISIETLWKDARARWPKLSKNAFLKARSDAIQDTGAVAWASGGAPKKSPSRQSSN
jgi:hypothetical protein